MTDEELAAVEKRAASVAAYHGEHAAFGGASFEFHARAQTTVADLFDEIRRLRDRLAAFDSCDRARRAAEEDVAALKAEVARLTDDTAAIVTASVGAALGEVVRQGGALGHIAAEAEGAGLREGAWKKTLTAKCYDALAASQAEVARLAGVAREACDNLRHSGGCDSMDDGPCDCYIAALRASIPTPGPAAFVAAVDAYGQWCGTIGASLATGGTPRFLADCERERDTYRAALLALGGVR